MAASSSKVPYFTTTFKSNNSIHCSKQSMFCHPSEVKPPSNVERMFETFHLSGDTNVQQYNPFDIKRRRRTSKSQYKVLERVYAVNCKPSIELRKQLADQLGMPPRSVQVWFQNRRAKSKQHFLRELPLLEQAIAAGDPSASVRLAALRAEMARVDNMVLHSIDQQSLTFHSYDQSQRYDTIDLAEEGDPFSQDELSPSMNAMSHQGSLEKLFQMACQEMRQESAFNNQTNQAAETNIFPASAKTTPGQQMVPDLTHSYQSRPLLQSVQPLKKPAEASPILAPSCFSADTTPRLGPSLQVPACRIPPPLAITPAHPSAVSLPVDYDLQCNQTETQNALRRSRARSCPDILADFSLQELHRLLEQATQEQNTVSTKTFNEAQQALLAAMPDPVANGMKLQVNKGDSFAPKAMTKATRSSSVSVSRDLAFPQRQNETTDPVARHIDSLRNSILRDRHAAIAPTSHFAPIYSNGASSKLSGNFVPAAVSNIDPNLFEYPVVENDELTSAFLNTDACSTGEELLSLESNQETQATADTPFDFFL